MKRVIVPNIEGQETLHTTLMTSKAFSPRVEKTSVVQLHHDHRVRGDLRRQVCIFAFRLIHVPMRLKGGLDNSKLGGGGEVSENGHAGERVYGA